MNCDAALLAGGKKNQTNQLRSLQGQGFFKIMIAKLLSPSFPFMKIMFLITVIIGGICVTVRRNTLGGDTDAQSYR